MYKELGSRSMWQKGGIAYKIWRKFICGIFVLFVCFDFYFQFFEKQRKNNLKILSENFLPLKAYKKEQKRKQNS